MAKQELESKYVPKFKVKSERPKMAKPPATSTITPIKDKKIKGDVSSPVVNESPEVERKQEPEIVAAKPPIERIP